MALALGSPPVLRWVLGSVVPRMGFKYSKGLRDHLYLCHGGLMRGGEGSSGDDDGAGLSQS